MKNLFIGFVLGINTLGVGYLLYKDYQFNSYDEYGAPMEGAAPEYYPPPPPAAADNSGGRAVPAYKYYSTQPYGIYRDYLKDYAEQLKQLEEWKEKVQEMQRAKPVEKPLVSPPKA